MQHNATQGMQVLTCFPNLAEDLGRLQHARLVPVILLSGGPLEVHHIELQLSAQLGVCKLQGTSSNSVPSLGSVNCMTQAAAQCPN